MEYLWAPWRSAYIHETKPTGCILCGKDEEEATSENLVLYKTKLNFVMMNKFPYNPGHLMVAPFRHVASPEDFTDEELEDHYRVVRLSLRVLRETFHPSAFNMGANLGKVAGAGFADHCHTHIVPRWDGDTNFMPVIAGTKVVSDSMEAVYNQLKGKF